MVEHSPSLNSVFAAVADPTRRAILRKLGENPARVTDLAKNFPVSLNAISKHVMVLEQADLVKREIEGREHLLYLNARGLRDASEWILEMRTYWEQRLDAFERHILKNRKPKP